MSLTKSSTPPDPQDETGGPFRLQLFPDEEMNSSAEQPLLPRIARGDAEAVKRCIDRYTPLVWSLARRFLNHTGDVEDAVQEIFVAIWQNSSRFDPTQASEKTFIAMIARRRLIDRSRKTARRPLSEPLPDTIPTMERIPQIETNEQTARVLLAFEQLPDEVRRILKLALLSGHTHEEIATMTGLPLGTVKSHIRRGLIRVREVLDTTLERGGSMK